MPTARSTTYSIGNSNKVCTISNWQCPHFAFTKRSNKMRVYVKPQNVYTSAHVKEIADTHAQHRTARSHRLHCQPKIVQTTQTVEKILSKMTALMPDISIFSKPSNYPIKQTQRSQLILRSETHLYFVISRSWPMEWIICNNSLNSARIRRAKVVTSEIKQEIYKN